MMEPIMDAIAGIEGIVVQLIGNKHALNPTKIVEGLALSGP